MKYKYTKQPFKMRCWTESEGLHFHTSATAYKVNGEGLPDGLPLFVHKIHVPTTNTKYGFDARWVVSDGLSGLRFPKMWGYTRNEAVIEVLGMIEKLGMARVWTEMFYVSNEFKPAHKEINNAI